MLYLFFVLLGLFLGAFGTLVGTGGGFILVPVLLWLYPDHPPEYITSISLAVVCVNSLSGVWAYGRMKRVDFLSGTVFAAATIPGAVLGALSTTLLPRGTFETFIGFLLIATCIMLLIRPIGKQKATGTHPANAIASHHKLAPRKLILGALFSFFMGFFSSMLGISGGIFQVPMLVYLLEFPVHIAVATSEFVLSLKGFAAASVHLFNGNLADGIWQITMLSIGVALGAQVGAWISNHVKGEWIMRVLALSIGSIGLRFLMTALAL